MVASVKAIFTVLAIRLVELEITPELAFKAPETLVAIVVVPYIKTFPLKVEVPTTDKVVEIVLVPIETALLEVDTAKVVEFSILSPFRLVKFVLITARLLEIVSVPSISVMVEAVAIPPTIRIIDKIVVKICFFILLAFIDISPRSRILLIPGFSHFIPGHCRPIPD